jgi:50S ribosomal protein L16 3-hydroxylase
MYQLNLDIAHFLEHYWQKRPLLIKGGFTDFQDPISPDELAGLAMEEVIESRLVTRFNNKWEAAHGPFESYDHLGKRTGPCWCRRATTGYPRCTSWRCPSSSSRAGALTM